MKYIATSVTTTLIVLGAVFAIQAWSGSVAKEAPLGEEAAGSALAPTSETGTASASATTRVVCTRTVGDDEDDREGDDEDDSKVTCVEQTVTAPLQGGAKRAEPAATQPAQDGAKSYTLAEVRAHASASSCWMAIGGKVYDVTSFISSHPGGQEILRGCGKDATTLFSTQHAGSRLATAELAALFIGALK